MTSLLGLPILILISCISSVCAITPVPLASKTIPGVDSPPAFLASCTVSNLIYYNIWDSIFVYNLTSNISSSIFDAPSGQFISYMAPSCTASGVLYFAHSDLDLNPTSIPKVYNLKSIIRRTNRGPTPIPVITETGTYLPTVNIPAVTTSPPFLVDGESAYFLSNRDGIYVPVRASHPSRVSYLWGTRGDPLVQKMFSQGFRTSMKVVNDIFAFTVRDSDSNIYPAFANTSVSNASPTVLTGPGDFFSETAASRRTFMTEIFPAITGKGIQYCFISTVSVSNYTIELVEFRISSLDSPIMSARGADTVFSANVWNASLNDAIRASTDMLPVFGNSAFFFAINPTGPSSLVKVDFSSLDVTYNPAGDIATAVAQTASSVHKTSSGYILVYAGSSYRIDSTGVTLVPLLPGATIPLPPLSLCNNELIFSAAHLSNVVPKYFIFSTGMNASALQGTQVSTQFDFPAPLAVDTSPTSCVFAYWNETDGWRFAQFNRSSSAATPLQQIRRVSPTSVNLLPGTAQPQSAVVLCRLETGLMFTLETVRDGERFARLGVFVNETDYPVAPNIRSIDSEIRAIRFFCRAGRTNDDTSIVVAELEDSRFALYTSSGANFNSNGNTIGIISSNLTSFSVYSGSLLNLREGIHCLIATNRTQGAPPNANLFCFNGSAPTTSVYAAANLSPIFSYSNPAAFNYVMSVGDTHYIVAGHTLLRVVQNATNPTTIDFSYIVGNETLGSIDYVENFQGTIVLMFRNTVDSTIATLRGGFLSPENYCPNDSDPVDFSRNRENFLLSCKRRQAPRLLTLWSTRSLSPANFTLVDSHVCGSAVYCRYTMGPAAASYITYILFDQDNLYAFKTAFLPTDMPIVNRLIYNSTNPAEVSVQPRVTGAVLGFYRFTYFYNNDVVILSDGINHAAISVPAKYAMNPPRIFKSSDLSLRLYWSPRRLGPQRDSFGRIIYSEGFCWDEADCAAASTCVRPRCVAKSTDCPEPPPFSTAVCTSTGWVQNGNLIIGGGSSGNAAPSSSPTGAQVVIISSPISVNGDLIVQGSNSTPIIIQLSSPNATISISGCLAVSGTSLIVLLGPEIQSGANFTAVSFEGGYCDGSGTRFDAVTVQQDSGPECQRPIATPNYRPTSIDVLVRLDRDACLAPGATAVSEAGFQLWMIGAIVGSIIALLIIILVILFVFRKKIIPAHKMAYASKKFVASQDDK